MQRLEHRIICFFACNLHLGECLAALQILGLYNTMSESQGLYSVFPGQGSKDWSKESSARMAMYLYTFPQSHYSITCTEGTQKTWQKQRSEHEMRPDRESQPYLPLIQTDRLSTTFHNEPTNMPHGCNLLKGLWFRRVSVQFSMIATCALP